MHDLSKPPASTPGTFGGKVENARGALGDSAKRWPFELLQTPLDAGPREGKGSVALSLDCEGHTVVFEHDGAPFSMQELAALLSGGSSKDFDSTQTIGRFGTGFLVTHVLAERTKVRHVFVADIPPTLRR